MTRGKRAWEWMGGKSSNAFFWWFFYWHSPLCLSLTAKRWKRMSLSLWSTIMTRYVQNTQGRTQQQQDECSLMAVEEYRTGNDSHTHTHTHTGQRLDLCSRYVTIRRVLSAALGLRRQAPTIENHNVGHGPSLVITWHHFHVKKPNQTKEKEKKKTAAVVIA